MTTYTFKEFVAWPLGAGGALVATRNQRVNVYVKDTTTAPAGLTQNGQAVSWVTSDGEGALVFTTSSDAVVDLASVDGTFKRRVEAVENIGVAGAPASGGGSGKTIPSGWSSLIFYDNNSVASFGATAGTEYAVATPLAAMTVSQVGIRVNVGMASTTMHIGFRLIDPSTGIAGPAVIDAAVSVATTGWQVVTLGSPVALAAGLYAITWTRIGGTGAVSLGNWSGGTPVFGLAVQTAGTTPATGHGPLIGVLNTGIAGALPSSVVTTGVGTNLEGNTIPCMTITRSA